MDTLDTHIRDWKNALDSIGVIGKDLEKMEANLSDEISVLRGQGLSEAEAFIIATQRIGQIHGLSRTYFININKLWKRLSIPAESTDLHQGIWLTIVLATVAALFAQTPYLFSGSYLGALCCINSFSNKGLNFRLWLAAFA